MDLSIAVRYGLDAAEPELPEGSAALAAVVILACAHRSTVRLGRSEPGVEP